MAPWWFPANDHPRDKATFDITFSAPTGKQVVSNGDARRHADRPEASPSGTGGCRSRWRPISRSSRSAGSGSSRASTTADPGTTRCRRSTRRTSRTTRCGCCATPRAWSSGSSSSSGTTRSTRPEASWSGATAGFALENQSRPTYPFLGNGAGARLVVLHELAHQWFGDDVVASSAGATSGSTRASRPGRSGATPRPTAASARRASCCGRTATRPASRAFWDVHVAGPGVQRLFDEPVYVRGAMTLQALRHRLGTTTFLQLMRTWVQDHQGGSARTSSVRGARRAAQRQARSARSSTGGCTPGPGPPRPWPTG